jgi:putative spermidine/putrescine transport system ATP-binding protein
VTIKLKVEKLRKTYGPVVALAGADLEMQQGEFLTMLGPSGSGKTTMLQLLTGVVQPDSGEIWIDGQLATYAPTHKRDIGMVFQNYALFPHLSVRENIAFPLRMRKRPESEIDRRVRNILEIVQLPHVADRLPRELSGGQQQRIALARCTVYEPSIILMDEPLGALDKKLRDQMQLEIKHLHTKLGITVLYVTHDQEEAMVMSDRICLMSDGKIVQLGTPADLYFRPLSVFAANFLGESNIFQASVTGRDAQGLLLRGAGGANVRALAADVMPGADVSYMVRPENVRVLANGDQAENMLDATLVEVIVVGGVTRFHAVQADGSPMSATRLTDGPADAVEPGQPIRFGWTGKHTVVLPRP